LRTEHGLDCGARQSPLQYRLQDLCIAVNELP
jgi:hypothetical protein